VAELGVVQSGRVWLITRDGRVAHLCATRQTQNGNIQGMAACGARPRHGWYSPSGQPRCLRCVDTLKGAERERWTFPCTCNKNCGCRERFARPSICERCFDNCLEGFGRE